MIYQLNDLYCTLISVWLRYQRRLWRGSHPAINDGLFLAQVFIDSLKPGQQVLGPDQLRSQDESLKLLPQLLLAIGALLALDEVQVGDSQLGVVVLNLESNVDRLS